jgi:hypothetical protein
LLNSTTTMRKRAARCREIAKDYDATVGAPLYEQAAALEAEAARLERQGIERRRHPLAV